MAWYERARAGDKVVCIAAGKWGDGPGLITESEVVVGEIYTIHGFHSVADGIYLILKECSKRAAYRATQFRPVQRNNRSTETGMKILQDIASRKHQPIDTPELSEAVTHYRKPAFQKGGE